MSHLGTGELSSLIMNTLGSYELKTECASDTSAPSISKTVSSLSSLSATSATSAIHDCCETDQSGKKTVSTRGKMNNVATTFRDGGIMSV